MINTNFAGNMNNKQKTLLHSKESTVITNKYQGMKITSITTDGFNYFLSVPNPSASSTVVLKTDNSFKVLSTHTIYKLFDVISYNFDSCSFYASFSHCSDYIYELNRSFFPINKLLLNNKGVSSYFGNITSISFDYERDNILITFSNCIAFYSKNGELISFKQTELSSTILSDYLLLPPYELCLYYNKNKYQCTLNREKSKLLSLIIPSNIIPVGISTTIDKDINQICVMIIGKKYSEIDKVLTYFVPLSCLPEIPHKSCYHENAKPFDIGQACYPKEIRNNNLNTMESFLSDILDAERKKIESLISNCKNPEDVVMINSAIDNTIKNVMNMEEYYQNQALHSSQACKVPIDSNSDSPITDDTTSEVSQNIDSIKARHLAELDRDFQNFKNQITSDNQRPNV